VYDVVIGDGKYPAKKVSISYRNERFQPGYWYVLQNGEYNYSIKSRIDGYGAANTDGEKTTKEKFPEFYKILSTFRFIN